ncbi:hypothetical protein BGLA2_1390016 [Burkholderia gladioli]|nr:hypothetical protein BGLA2_1390016 [Burkholderia gladioli]
MAPKLPVTSVTAAPLDRLRALHYTAIRLSEGRLTLSCRQTFHCLTIGAKPAPAAAHRPRLTPASFPRGVP